jgi:hypothetical protein
MAQATAPLFDSTHDCVRCAAKFYDAIGTTTDNGLREGRIGPQLLTRHCRVEMPHCRSA